MTIRRLGVLGLALLALGARAEELAPPRYDLRTDGAITGGAAAATLVLLSLKRELAPRQCRWCGPRGVDARLEGSLRWRRRQLASDLSDGAVVALAGGALGCGVLRGTRRGDAEAGWANALVVAEATSLAMLLDTGVKYAVARQRPYAWRGGSGPGGDRNLSFFSGHATLAFAVAASSSTLLLEQDAPGARTYAAVAFGLATTAGYLRVAADRHYASDVLAGAAVGTAIGWAIPHFLHQPAGKGPRLAAAPGGLAVVW